MAFGRQATRHELCAFAERHTDKSKIVVVAT